MFLGISWQDYIFSIGLVFYVITTWPMFKISVFPPYGTCIPYGILPVVYSVPQFSYENWISGFLSIALGFMWFYIAHLKYKKEKEM